MVKVGMEPIYDETSATSIQIVGMVKWYVKVVNVFLIFSLSLRLNFVKTPFFYCGGELVHMLRLSPD